MENGDEEDLARLKLNIPPKTDGLEKKKKKKRPKVEGQLEPGVEGQEKPKKKKIKLLNKELKDKGDKNSFFFIFNNNHKFKTRTRNGRHPPQQ